MHEDNINNLTSLRAGNDMHRKLTDASKYHFGRPGHFRISSSGPSKQIKSISPPKARTPGNNNLTVNPSAPPLQIHFGPRSGSFCNLKFKLHFQHLNEQSRLITIRVWTLLVATVTVHLHGVRISSSPTMGPFVRLYKSKHYRNQGLTDGLAYLLTFVAYK